MNAQTGESLDLEASIIAQAALGEVESQTGEANKAHSELWLVESSQVVFCRTASNCRASIAPA